MRPQYASSISELKKHSNRYDDELELDSTVTHALRAGARLLGDFNDYASWKV